MLKKCIRFQIFNASKYIFKTVCTPGNYNCPMFVEDLQLNTVTTVMFNDDVVMY